jgi:hypothetical protein
MGQGNDDKELWDFMLQQDNVMLQQFGTAVIGIGALIFAYAQIVPLHLLFLNIIVALIGLAASLIVWMNMYGSIQQGRAIRDNLRATRSPLMQRYDQIMEWRDKRVNHWVYYPVKRLEMYFSALVSLAWVTVILTAFGVNIVYIEAFDAIAFGLTVLHALLRWHQKDTVDTSK